MFCNDLNRQRRRRGRLEKQKHRQESSIDNQVNSLFYSLDGPLFDHEKLDVYGVELGFVA
jgi:hypothetical protein